MSLTVASSSDDVVAPPKPAVAKVPAAAPSAPKKTKKGGFPFKMFILAAASSFAYMRFKK